MARNVQGYSRELVWYCIHYCSDAVCFITIKTVSLSSSLKKERNGRKTEIERSGVGELILTCVWFV